MRRTHSSQKAWCSLSRGILAQSCLGADYSGAAQLVPVEVTHMQDTDAGFPGLH